MMNSHSHSAVDRGSVRTGMVDITSKPQTLHTNLTSQNLKGHPSMRLHNRYTRDQALESFNDLNNSDPTMNCLGPKESETNIVLSPKDGDARKEEPSKSERCNSRHALLSANGKLADRLSNED